MVVIFWSVSSQPLLFLDRFFFRETSVSSGGGIFVLGGGRVFALFSEALLQCISFIKHLSEDWELELWGVPWHQVVRAPTLCKEEE